MWRIILSFVVLRRQDVDNPASGLAGKMSGGCHSLKSFGGYTCYMPYKRGSEKTAFHACSSDEHSLITSYQGTCRNDVNFPKGTLSRT